MNYKGLSIIIRNKKEFDTVKDFLGAENLYLDFVPQMSETETAVVVYSDYESCFSTGSTGSSEYQKEEGLRLVEFKKFFK
ncbi:MAG: hypothetical protein ACJA2M_002373 [Polaribacter sp.]|jgi:hypothetical protein